MIKRSIKIRHRMEAAIRLVLDEIWPATPGSPSGNAITGRLLGGRHFQSAHFLGGQAKKKIRDSEKHVDDPPPLEMRSNCIFFFFSNGEISLLRFAPVGQRHLLTALDTNDKRKSFA